MPRNAKQSRSGESVGRVLTIVAPGPLDGGFDKTARAMQRALQESGLAASVEVVNIAGTGGTVGLEEFARNSAGDPDKLLVCGYVTLAAAIAYETPMSISDVTPIARLTSEYDAIGVPVGSPIQTLDDLVALMRSDPLSVSWAMASKGVSDISVGSVVTAMGLDPRAVNVKYHPDGEHAVASTIRGDVTVGMTGYGEFARIEAGKLRMLGLASSTRQEGIDLATLSEQGLPVDLQNWRMVCAAPGISAAQEDAISTMVSAMARGSSWQAERSRNQWNEAFLAGSELRLFLDQQKTYVENILRGMSRTSER